MFQLKVDWYCHMPMDKLSIVVIPELGNPAHVPTLGGWYCHMPMDKLSIVVIPELGNPAHVPTPWAAPLHRCHGMLGHCQMETVVGVVSPTKKPYQQNATFASYAPPQYESAIFFTAPI
jgi:hypothetical protein